MNQSRQVGGIYNLIYVLAMWNILKYRYIDIFNKNKYLYRETKNEKETDLIFIFYTSQRLADGHTSLF